MAGPLAESSAAGSSISILADIRSQIVRARKSKTIKADSRNAEDELKAESANTLPKEMGSDSTRHAEEQEEEEDEDDIITNEIKRRLKELRRNNFMVLIPEESCQEEEESSSNDWRESDVKDIYSWSGFDAFYAKYSERMLFFDKIISQKLQNSGHNNSSMSSPKYAPKNLVSSIRRLSFKMKNGFQDDENEQLQSQPDNDEERECLDLETAYVAQVCLTWEAFHCQYTQLKQRILSQPEDPVFYSFATQQFQQFQVLLQRFIENEPFDHDSRVEIYARSRLVMPKLLQVPSLLGLEREEYEADEMSNSQVHASDLIEAMNESLLTFRNFLKMDKKKSSSGYLTLFVAKQREAQDPLHHVQNTLDKKEAKLKELFGRKKGQKKTKKMKNQEEVDLLFGLIDIKVVSRVLRMNKLSKEQLLWCEEKMSKLELAETCIQRDCSPVLFPC